MKKGLILISILVLGFLLRYNNYTVWPREGATFDEFAWTWLGMNIIQQHVPISWSPHPQYKIRTHYVSPKGTPFWLVQPYLEHPPVFGLVAGTFALLSGAKDMYSVDIQHMRGLALLLGLASIFLIFLLTKELYESKVALIAATLFATIPTIVIGSRIVQNENFFIPMFLFVLLMLTRYLKTSQKKYLISSSVVAGILTLAKVPWWSAAVSCILLLLYKKRIKDAFIFAGISSACFSLFFVWGAYWDIEVFQNLWKLQLNRYDITFEGIYSLFTNPILVDRSYLDGWILVGWFAFFSLFSDFKKHAVIITGLLGYFAVYILAIPNEPSHGWYRYPFYPFLIIALSVVSLEAVKKQLISVFFGISLIGLSLLQHTWNITFGFSYGIYRSFIIGAGLTGLSTFFHGKVPVKISKYSAYIFISMLLLLNIWAVLLYNEQ